MALKSGTYIISSVSADSYIGRNLAEDLSLNPKRVIILPKGVEAPKVRRTPFSSDTVPLTNSPGAPVGYRGAARRQLHLEHPWRVRRGDRQASLCRHCRCPESSLENHTAEAARRRHIHVCLCTLPKRKK